MGPSGAGSEGRSLGLWFVNVWYTCPFLFSSLPSVRTREDFAGVLLHSFTAMPVHPLFKFIIKLSHEQKKPCSL